RTTGATACTAGAAASRSRASLPVRGRRTRAAPRCSRASSPDDDAASDAQPPHVYVPQARLPPQCDDRREGIALVEAADARAEEPADLPPCRRDQRAGTRQTDADVQLPERPPHPAWDAELEHRHRASAPDDARLFAHRRRWVVHVAQEVCERQRVEFTVPK